MLINVTPKKMQNGDIISYYKNTVDTAGHTFTFPNSQERVKVSNLGSAPISYTIGTKTGTLGISESIEVTETITQFTLTASTKTQAFEVLSDESGGNASDFSQISTQLNDVTSSLNGKVSSTNIKSIRDSANVFEYSLDGTTWKQVQGGAGGSAPNTKNLDDYSSLSSSNTNWSPAFAQVFSDLGAAGGFVQLGAKTYTITSTITIPSNIQIVGLGQGVSTIRLANGSNVDMITLDTNDNCGISNLTIKGNCFDASPSSGKDGLVLGRPGINTTNNEGDMSNINIHDIEIRDIGGNGFRCYSGTWIYYLSRVRIHYCTGYGAYIQSTDNLYDAFDITANGQYGLYVTGSNNRFSNMKIIFNGRGPVSAGKYYGNGTDLNSAGVYCASGTRNTFVNIESQENYGHGFVFDGAKDADLIGLVADKNGYSKLAPDGTTLTGTATAIGFYFINSSARLTGIIKATNFNQSLVSQRTGYFVDDSCSNISLDYEGDSTQTGLSVNLSYSSVVTSADTKALALALAQYNDLFVSGQTFNNLITAYNTSVFSLGATFVTAGYTISGNDIYGSTNWAGTPRMGTVGNSSTAVVADNIYLVRVKVKPDTNNYFLRTKAIYNDGAFETIKQIDGNYTNAAYTDVSFVIKAPRAGNLMFLVEDKVGANNATQGAFHISEVAIINITAAVTAKYYPKTIDLLVKKNYFVGSRTFT